MLLIFPISYSFETTLSPKKAAAKLERELVLHRPTGNVMAQGRFMRKHRFETIYYGCRTSADRFRVFHHTAKKRDGASTGFFGRIEKTSGGSLISGSFRKPIYVYVCAALWTIVTLLISLVLFALQETAGAAVSAGLFVTGILIMFWDDKKKYIRAYLDTFPRAEEKR